MEQVFNITDQIYEVDKNGKEVLWTEFTVDGRKVPQKAINAITSTVGPITTESGFGCEGKKDGFCPKGDPLADFVHGGEHLLAIELAKRLKERGTPREVSGWQVLFSPRAGGNPRKGIIEITVCSGEQAQDRLGEQYLIPILNNSLGVFSRLVRQNATEKDFLRYYLGR